MSTGNPLNVRHIVEVGAKMNQKLGCRRKF